MAGLLTPPRDRLVPVEREPLPAAMPAAIASPGYSASLSADQQTITDVLSQVYRGTSVVRMAPLPPSASATSNAAANSAAQVIVENSSSGSGGTTVSGVSSVELDMPLQFAVSGSPGTGVVDLGVTWTSEPAGYILQAPLPGLGSFQGATVALSSTGGPSNAVSVSQTAAGSTALAIVSAYAFGTGGHGAMLSSGWTQAGTAGAWYKNISGSGPVTASLDTVASGIQQTATLSLFSGPPPSFVQAVNLNSTTTSAATFNSITNTAGNTLVMIANLATGTGGPTQPALGPTPISATDSLGNTWVQLLNSTYNPNYVSGPNDQTQTAIFVCVDCLGGANTVQFNYAPNILVSTQVGTVLEFGPLPAGSSIPFFGPLVTSQIPIINLASSSNGGVGGVLPVAKGGTGVVLSTGTTRTVLSASPTFTGTVGLPIVTLTGTVTDYNNISTVSNGIPAEYATVDLTGQGAAIAATTLYAPLGGATGMYRISWSATITTADGVSSSLGGTNGFQVKYTSPTDSVAKTTAPQTPWATGLNTTGTADGGVMVIYAKGGTNIQYAYDYTSATPGQMKYELHIKLESL